MLNGFDFCMPDFCSYCGEFEPDVKKQETTAMRHVAKEYITEIHCMNEEKCLRLAANLGGRI